MPMSCSANQRMIRPYDSKRYFPLHPLVIFRLRWLLLQGNTRPGRKLDAQGRGRWGRPWWLFGRFPARLGRVVTIMNQVGFFNDPHTPHFTGGQCAALNSTAYRIWQAVKKFGRCCNGIRLGHEEIVAMTTPRVYIGVDLTTDMVYNPVGSGRPKDNR